MKKGEKRKQELLKIAYRMFVEKGYDNTSIDEIIARSPKEVEGYRNGRDRLFDYFVGQVMKVSRGKANPQSVIALLKEKLQ